MRLIALPALAVVAIAVGACGGSDDTASVPSTPAPTTSEKSGTKESAGSAEAEGKQVFVANCSTCHTLSDAGANGMAGPNLDQLQPSEATVKAHMTAILRKLGASNRTQAVLVAGRLALDPDGVRPPPPDDE